MKPLRATLSVDTANRVRRFFDKANPELVELDVLVAVELSNHAEDVAAAEHASEPSDSGRR